MNEIKSNKKKLDDEVIKFGSMILFNISAIGFDKSDIEERNIFQKSFYEINGIKRMYELFHFLNTLNSEEERTEEEKETVNFIAISICYLFKSNSIPLSYFDLIIYLYNFKSLPSPSSGFDFPYSARYAWTGFFFFFFFF
jgi:hypothetical protein